MQVRHAFIFFYLLLQLLCCCIPANYITNEAMEVSNAVYSSKWYTQEIRPLKVPLLIMIQNAQNEVIVKAGGLFVINAATALTVLKTAWSVCSLMKGIH